MVIKGGIPWNKGKTGLPLHSKEHKRKIRLSVSGSKNGMFGKKHSDKTKRKIGLGNIGNKSRLGQPLSEEQKLHARVSNRYAQLGILDKFKDYLKARGLNVDEIKHNYCIKDYHKLRNHLQKLDWHIRAYMIYNQCCQNCDNDNIIVLEWHHKIANNGKEGSTSTILRIIRSGKILDDIELLCANCHLLADLRDQSATKGKLKKEISDYWKEFINAY